MATNQEQEANVIIVPSMESSSQGQALEQLSTSAASGTSQCHSEVAPPAAFKCKLCWGSGIVAALVALGVGGYFIYQGMSNYNIDIVQHGYLPQDNKRNISEILTMCSYVKESEWKNLKSQGEISQVGYEGTLDNNAIVSWVIPKSSDLVKKQVSVLLDDMDFKLKLKLQFAVYKNKSFELHNASLSYKGHNVASNKDELVDALIASKPLGSFAVSPQTVPDFNQVLYGALATNTKVGDEIKVGRIGDIGEIFSNAVFSHEKIYRAFHPLTFSNINTIKVDTQSKSIDLTAKMQVLDVNDYRLNEVGLSIYEDGYGIVSGLKRKTSKEIVKLLGPYKYEVLLSQKLKLSAKFSDFTPKDNPLLQDLELETMLVSDNTANQAILRYLPRHNEIIFSFKPHFNEHENLKQFVLEQQNIINYTAVAYPLAYAATSIASLTSKQNDSSFFSTMLTIRNKIMREAGERIMPPLQRSQDI